MAKHKTFEVWPDRTSDNKPPTGVFLTLFTGGGKTGWSFPLSRRDARLLAQRINQCLEETK